ncbi:MAG: porin family protein [Desulfobulbaceae bacterium]|nr:porin family protein [Desulfobulbaceae bacterium]
MKKILSAVAVSVFVMIANQAVAGSSAAPSIQRTTGCSKDCQKQIDDLRSQHALNNERISNNQERSEQNSFEINQLKEANPWYVKGVIGMAWSGSLDINVPDWKAETDSGYCVGTAIGRQFGQFRVEGEFATQINELKAADSSDLRINSGMVNGFYDFPLNQAFSLYGMVGIGAAKVDINVQQVDDSEVAFAYRTGMGVAYAINRQMAVDLGYEYMRTADVELNNDLRLEDIKNSNVTAAFRYSF